MLIFRKIYYCSRRIPTILVGTKFPLGLLQIYNNNLCRNKIPTLFVANRSHNPSGNKIPTSIVVEGIPTSLLGLDYNSKSCG